MQPSGVLKFRWTTPIAVLAILTKGCCWLSQNSKHIRILSEPALFWPRATSTPRLGRFRGISTGFPSLFGTCGDRRSWLYHLWMPFCSRDGERGEKLHEGGSNFLSLVLPSSKFPSSPNMEIHRPSLLSRHRAGLERTTYRESYFWGSLTRTLTQSRMPWWLYYCENVFAC